MKLLGLFLACFAAYIPVSLLLAIGGVDSFYIILASIPVGVVVGWAYGMAID